MIRYASLKTTVILSVLIFFSCSQHVETGRSSPPTTAVTLAQLLDSWQKYFINYSTRIVVFDPIHDDNTIEVPGDWIMIEDAGKLAEIFNRLELNPRFDPDDI